MILHSSTFSNSQNLYRKFTKKLFFSCSNQLEVKSNTLQNLVPCSSRRCDIFLYVLFILNISVSIPSYVHRGDPSYARTIGFPGTPSASQCAEFASPAFSQELFPYSLFLTRRKICLSHRRNQANHIFVPLPIGRLVSPCF